MAKIGRNEPCPCGSGRKYKKCCGDSPARQAYTAEDRARAFARLDAWIDVFAEDEAEDAHEEFWGRFIDDADELPDDLAMLSEQVEDLWFALDYVGDRGTPIVDVLLAEADLDEGERAFLSALRQTSMRLYEVVDSVPGVSLTLRDAIEGGQVTVTERRGSRSIGRHMYIAARVVSRGPSGGPEIEAGLLHIPGLVKDLVIAQLREHRARFLEENRGALIDEFYSTMPPFYHEVWAGSFLDAYVPTPKTDGEDMAFTKVAFDIVDNDELSRSLDAHAELERQDTGWTWSGANRQGKPATLGTIERRGERLQLETLTVERAERGRALLETLAGSAIRHHSTVHESVQRALKDRIRAKYLRGEALDDDDDDDDESDADAASGGLSPEITEPLILGHYGTHYRAWIDEPVPALDGKTPREGARDPKLRERTIELVQDLVAIYQNALRSGQPAYDPSWMWAELGLVDEEAVRHPPPLVYERVASTVEGTADLVRAVAERLRAQPGFDEASTVVADDALSGDLEIQRFVRDRGAAAAPYLRAMIDHELHRRKTFWVDDALAYMLDQTDLDVVGRELRVPFPAFALVFTDRHVLSLAERLLAKSRDTPLAGQLLRVATVHITEHLRGQHQRVLEICFAFDALGADLPAFVRHEIALEDEAQVRTYLDAIAPLPEIDPPPPDTSPVRGLLRTTINAILYATSASVTPQLRSPPARSRAKPRQVFSSDEVYYLPGTIDITRVRELQALERAPEGRALLRRHMVRGHWRRAAKNWTDHRLRWIEPYWKGPDMAAIIEHAYRLKA